MSRSSPVTEVFFDCQQLNTFQRRLLVPASTPIYQVYVVGMTPGMDVVLELGPLGARFPIRQEGDSILARNGVPWNEGLYVSTSGVTYGRVRLLIVGDANLILSTPGGSAWDRAYRRWGGGIVAPAAGLQGSVGLQLYKIATGTPKSQAFERALRLDKVIVTSSIDGLVTVSESQVAADPPAADWPGQPRYQGGTVSEVAPAGFCFKTSQGGAWGAVQAGFQVKGGIPLVLESEVWEIAGDVFDPNHPGTWGTAGKVAGLALDGPPDATLTATFFWRERWVNYPQG